MKKLVALAAVAFTIGFIGCSDAGTDEAPPNDDTGPEVAAEETE